MRACCNILHGTLIRWDDKLRSMKFYITALSVYWVCFSSGQVIFKGDLITHKCKMQTWPYFTKGTTSVIAFKLDLIIGVFSPQKFMIETGQKCMYTPDCADNLLGSSW